MKKYTVEKNIDMPSNLGRKKKYNFPFSDMEIGDSFFVSGVGRTGEIESAKFQMTSIKKKSSIEFTSKTYPDGLRIWRIK